MADLDIHTFLSTIFGDQTGWIVCGLMDQSGPKGILNRQHDFYYPDNINDIVEWCETHRNSDAYVSPLIYGDMRNPKNNHIRRIPENSLTTLVAYQDSDSCTPDKFRLTPTIHITSSAGRYQDYWLLTEPVKASDAADASRRIAIAHRQDGSDPSSWSANKFLRIPGSTNTRHGFPERVVGKVGGDIYDLSDINEAYSDVKLETRAIARIPVERSYGDVQDLPNYSTAMDKLPSGFKLSLITDEPHATQDRSRMRYLLLCDLFRAGLDFDDVLSIAWHAPASQKWREDDRNLNGLIAEALKAQTEIAYQSGFTAEQVTAQELVASSVKQELPEVALLDDEERILCQGENDFIKRYQNWSRVKLGAAYNAPYARMNAWSALAGAFSDLGIVSSNGDSLNLFIMAIGGSGSGKSSSRRLWDKLMTEIFPDDAGWMIGSNASPEALHEKLIERDTKVSFFSADEAHGWFKRVNGNQWADGTYENLAEYYDGDVPPLLRTSAGKREISGKRAKSYFSMHMMGTRRGEMSLPAVLTTSMFYSGFLARFLWFIGEDREVTDESLRETNGDGEYANNGYEPQARQWAAEFADTKKRLRAKHRRMRIPMNMTQGALERMSLFKRKATDLASQRKEWEILEPCMTRIGPNVRRAATLLALEEGLDVVELRHVVLAIEAAEEWLSCLFSVAAEISASAFAREVDEIEMFLIAKGGQARREVVFRKFASRNPRDLMVQLEALHSQGRVIEDQEKQQKILRIVAGKEE